MPTSIRQAAKPLCWSLVPLLLCALAVAVLAAGEARADTKWPSMMRYTLSVSTAEDARYQASLGFWGPINKDKTMNAKVEGWWIGGGGDTRAFVGDAYIDYDRKPIYLAGGRKFIMFGPGVLVSPGIFGGQLKLDADRWEIQVLSGTLQFTPGVGTTRFSFFGARQPSDIGVTAARVAAPLTASDAKVPVKLGVNWLHVQGDSGDSVDLEVGATKLLTIFGEAASFDDASAKVYGVRWSDAAKRHDPKVWIVSVYWRDIDIGFVPSIVGASVYFEDQSGIAGGAYHQINDRQGFGLFADSNDAILTWFSNVPL